VDNVSCYSSYCCVTWGMCYTYRQIHRTGRHEEHRTQVLGRGRTMMHYCEICEKMVESIYDENIKGLEYSKGVCGHISIVHKEVEAEPEPINEDRMLA
jgi:hypothetical protein